MHRRNFLTTLPLAATPALTADTAALAQGGRARDAAAEGWTDLAAAAVTDLGGAPTRNVRITGSADISSFGPAPSGTTRLARFAGELVLKHHPETLILPNGGQDLFVSPNDVVLAVSLGSGAWTVASYQPASVFAKADRRASKGGGSFRLSIGADGNTMAPDFAIDGAYERTKTVFKSAILCDPQDTTEIGAVAATGTPASPGVWAGRAPHHIAYSFAPHIPLDTQGAPNNATYNGRFAQEYFFQVETPGPRARGGGIAWGVTMPGQIVPYDRMWLRNYGLVLPGRAAFEDSGHAFGYEYGQGPGGARANYHHIFAPGSANWGDVAGWGNLSLIASDHATGCAAIAIRRTGALASGFDVMMDHGAGELQLNTVTNDVRSPRWGWSAEGHQRPAADRAVDLGAPDRRLRALYADRLNISRAASGPAARIGASGPGFSGELLRLEAGGANAADVSFLKAVTTYGEEPHETLRIDGAGSGLIDGAWIAGGAGAAEFMEWADGNPPAEDRVGWSVVIEAGKIRRAGAADPREAVVGVVTARPMAAGNAAWNHWSGKHLRDDFGRPKLQPVAYVRWEKPITETREVERRRMVTETVRQPKREETEVVERTPRLELVGGRWVRRSAETRRLASRPVTETVVIHDEDGAPRLNVCGEIETAEVPLYEEVEIERAEPFLETVEVETGRVRHAYREGAAPAGVVVPADAERVVVMAPALNPDFDPARTYVGRQARPEWAAVTASGRAVLRKGERTGDRWIKLRDVSDQAEEWFVR